MKIRTAKISDVNAIYALINHYAERDRMLFRSMADIYENLQAFFIADVGGAVVGCCALQVIWSDLGEIKSLAVKKENAGRGIGKMLMNSALKYAKEIGLKKVFALTMEKDFFKKLGFKVVDKNSLPMKVWSDCAKCPKQNSCDEIAVIKRLG